MDYFDYREGRLLAENVDVTEIADAFGTPCYIYSRAAIERQWRAFDDAFNGHPHLVCYAVKANSNIGILNLLARMGSGFDIVSGGELQRVIVAGGDPNKIVFSGVGKREDEIRKALAVGIRCFNVEVAGELDRINRIAGELGVKAPVSFRVNPDVDAQTHPYISTGLKENKFGIEIDVAVTEYQRAASMQNIDVKGIDCHIGSQLTQTAPFLDALDRVLFLLGALKREGIDIRHLDLGGGLGVRYRDELPPSPGEHVTALLDRLNDIDCEVFLEPGRAIVGNAGILVTKVEYLKPTSGKNFAIVDAAMNDLIRPALYSAWQDIVPVNLNTRESSATGVWDIVGPVCETGDFLGKDRMLSLAQGDLLAIRSSGAYGFTMSSNYNSRPRAVEVMVDGDRCQLIRERESIESLWMGERIFEQ